MKKTFGLGLGSVALTFLLGCQWGRSSRGPTRNHHALLRLMFRAQAVTEFPGSAAAPAVDLRE
jgi:hypothetical protein